MTIQANFPALKPALLLDFQNTKQLDSRITYTRASTASYYDGVTTSKAEENQLTYSNEVSTARWTGSGISTTINNSTSPDGTTTATLLTASAGADSRIRITTTQAVSTTHTFSIYAKAGATSWLRLRNIGSNDCSGWFNLTTGAVGTVSGGTSAITSVGSGWYRCSITSTSASSIANNLLDMGAPSGDNTQASAGGETISVWGVQLEARSSVSALTVTTTQAITNYIPKLQSAASGVARFDHNPTTGESLGLLIEQSRTNLFTYSEQFDNAAWTKQASTVTANAIVSPDGSLDGEKLDETTANDTHRLEQNVTTVNGTVYTISVFAKAAERQWVYLFEDSATNACTFNLATGAVGTTQGSVTASISSVGNGWYRCSLTYTQSGTTGRMRIAVANGTSTISYTGVANNGIFIWGAQVEAGAFATSYIPTVASQVTRAADAASMTGTNFSSWFNNAQGTFVAIVGAGNIYTGARVLKVSDTDLNRLIDFYLISSPSQEIYSYQNGIVSANFSAGTISTSKYLTAVSYATGNISALINGGSVTTSTSAVVSSVANSTFAIGYDSISGANQLARPIAKIAYYPIRVTSAQLQALTS